MKHFLITGCLFIGLVSITQAQITPESASLDTTKSATDDSLRNQQQEDVKVKEIETYGDRFVPRQASLYSAILPGMGQAYNENYWKIPIIYGGFIALGFTIDFYDGQYKELRKDLFVLLEEGGNTTPLGFSEEQVRSQIDKARRERDFWMIMTGVLYLLQVAEAHIDAHLKEFKLNPDLRVSVEPMIERPKYVNNGYNAGLSLKLKF